MIYLLRDNERPLFESIMPVVLVLSIALFVYFYFKKVKTDFLKEGALLGSIWFAISIGLDLLMFMWGPMKMSFVDYMKDIGTTYIIIPIVVIAMAYSYGRGTDINKAGHQSRER